MAMENEILIPVRRRHADSRADLEDMVTKAKHWGYTEDDESILVRQADSTARYHARSALMRPGTAYDRVVIVDANDFVGINTAPDGDWAAGFDTILELGNTTGSNPTLFAEGSGLFLSNNIYNDGAYKRKIEGVSSILISGATEWKVMWAATGAADQDINALLYNRLEIDSTETVFNEDGQDIDFRIETNNETNTLFVEGSSDCIGIRTNTPLLNIGTAGSNLNTALHKGLHIKGDGDENDYAYLIIEGMGEAGNGNSGAYAAHLLMVADNAGANLKIMEMRTGYSANFIEFRSLYDNLDEKRGLVLVIDGAAGNIGMGTRNFSAACVNNLAIAEGTAPGGATADQCYIWAQDDTGTAEMYVQDGAGNQLKFSPHNEKGEWVFHCKNVVKKEVVDVNMEKLVKFLDKEFGTNFFQVKTF